MSWCGREGVTVTESIAYRLGCNSPRGGGKVAPRGRVSWPRQADPRRRCCAGCHGSDALGQGPLGVARAQRVCLSAAMQKINKCVWSVPLLHVLGCIRRTPWRTFGSLVMGGLGACLQKFGN